MPNTRIQPGSYVSLKQSGELLPLEPGQKRRRRWPNNRKYGVVQGVVGDGQWSVRWHGGQVCTVEASTRLRLEGPGAGEDPLREKYRSSGRRQEHAAKSMPMAPRDRGRVDSPFPLVDPQILGIIKCPSLASTLACTKP